MRDFDTAFLHQPYSTGSCTEVGCSLLFQTAVCRWARTTFSGNDPVVCGTDASFGALARLLPTVDVYTFGRASVKDLHLD